MICRVGSWKGGKEGGDGRRKVMKGSRRGEVRKGGGKGEFFQPCSAVRHMFKVSSAKTREEDGTF